MKLGTTIRAMQGVASMACKGCYVWRAYSCGITELVQLCTCLHVYTNLRRKLEYGLLAQPLCSFRAAAHPRLHGPYKARFCGIYVACHTRRTLSQSIEG